MREETELEERLRSIERVLEVALDRAQESPRNANLIPSDERQAILEQRYSTSTPEFEKVAHSEQYSRCFAFLTTVCSSLAAKQNGDVTDEQYDVIQRVYRFSTGPVRAAVTGINPETDVEPSRVKVNRMTKEMHHLAARVRDVDLLTKEHTYSSESS